MICAMKKELYVLTMILLTAAVQSCDFGKNNFDVEEETLENLSHDMIVLGDKLEDPYSVDNMTKALASLYPTKADRLEIQPTDTYVRFLPKTEEEYDRIFDMGFQIMDHPLDYQIVKDGDYYHDPEIDEDEFTWLYCVLPEGTAIPSGIECEILDKCYISENDPVTRAAEPDIDWDAVERESFRLTGNSAMLDDMTKGSKSAPKGRVTIVDPSYSGGKPFGVAGVKVVCNSFVKFATDYTDRDGYYEMKKKYSSKVRYRLLFHNEKSFDIGFNKIIIPASTSNLGKWSSEGKDFEITSSSDRKLFCRCVVNNATYDYITRCGEDDLDITAPPKKLRIWIFQGMNVSSSVMMRHGAITENSLVKKFLGIYALIIKIFSPDITIGAKNLDTYAGLYAATCHELAHSSHFMKAGKDYWDKLIVYVLKSFIQEGGIYYGSGSDSNAGYCEVAEMWAYYMQNKLFNERYGGEMPTAGSSHWFHPQIFRYLDERGMTSAQIFKALTSSVTDRVKLRNKLLELYPEKSTIINQVFDRYEE